MFFERLFHRYNQPEVWVYHIVGIDHTVNGVVAQYFLFNSIFTFVKNLPWFKNLERKQEVQKRGWPLVGPHRYLSLSHYCAVAQLIVSLVDKLEKGFIATIKLFVFKNFCQKEDDSLFLLYFAHLHRVKACVKY